MIADRDLDLVALAPLAMPRTIATSWLRLVVRDESGCDRGARTLDASDARVWCDASFADDHVVVVIEQTATGAQQIQAFHVETGAPAGLQVDVGDARIATHPALREVVIATSRSLAVWGIDGTRRGEWSGVFVGESALGASIVVHVDEDLISVLDRARGARRHVRNPRRRDPEVVSLDPDEQHVDVVWSGGKVDRISLGDGHLAPLGHHLGARWMVSRPDRVYTADEHVVIERCVVSGATRAIDGVRGPLGWESGRGVLLGVSRDGRVVAIDG
ncbi:hypothetical protein [Sandaracinus amylolyticus]|uniref:Uncharacterized protein n=1 Tax=Sandaracinus amylolyticus TaxID=927083 RepID=A0A0F6YLV7_9BACT|nr:hypothetical protein [Sandaracinus amylolyticus]AKF10351.1 hypothetical protein DB32_007500 [Sandaracinus amylolyticus]